MNFNFQRHVRIAGSVVTVVGLLLHNWSIVILGNLVIVVGYMVTVTKIEAYIESQEPKSKEEDEDARN